MPFVTEEIYHQLRDRTAGDDITVKQQKSVKTDVNSPIESAVLRAGQLLQNSITATRDARNKSGLKPKESIKLYIQTASADSFESIVPLLAKQVSAEEVVFVNEPVPNSINFVVGTHKFFIETNQQIDTAAQKDKLEKELEYHKGFLVSVEKKLSNERFVQNAKPEVVDAERKKKSDAEQKIKAIEESLSGL